MSDPATTDTGNHAAWDYLRTGAVMLGPPGAVDLHCERCQAFQGQVTDDALYLGGCKITQPVRLTCRRCGHEWHDRGPQSGR